MYALITGASSGLGVEFAKQLARCGYDLILVARRLERLVKLQKLLERNYEIHVKVKQCDLSVQENCFSLYEQYKDYPIHVVINNAGFGKLGYFSEVPLFEELEMIQTNVVAPHILTKLFMQHMKKGYILNVASVSGLQPTPMMATYGATKAYVLNLTKAINYELRKQHRKLHVATLCPGPVDTEFNKVAKTDFSLRSITAKQCVREALDGMFRRKMVITPSIPVKILSCLSKLSPTEVTLKVEYFIQTKKTNGTLKPEKKIKI